MFKHASIFKITLPQPMLVSTLDDAARAYSFTPCGATQERSIGWVSPRGGNKYDLMVENIGGHLIMSMMVETKTVPAQTLHNTVDKMVKNMEDTTGRKPGKKQRREMADEAKLSLLPMAFTSKSATKVWIDPELGMLVIDSASQSRTDEIISALVRLMDGIAVQYLSTNESPSAAMSNRLLAEADEFLGNQPESGLLSFSLGRACELHACDESKAKVRYQNHSLDLQQVRDHIASGKIPAKLALVYDDRVAFVLTSSGAMTGINFLELVFEDAAKRDGGVDAFDADVAIMTGELSLAIDSLIHGMGGEAVGGSQV